MSSHAVRAALSEANIFRKSVGTLCLPFRSLLADEGTVPVEILWRAGRTISFLVISSFYKISYDFDRG